jgi:hypothetical protein
MSDTCIVINQRQTVSEVFLQLPLDEQRAILQTYADRSVSQLLPNVAKSAFQLLTW